MKAWAIKDLDKDNKECVEFVNKYAQLLYTIDGSDIWTSIERMKWCHLGEDKVLEHLRKTNPHIEWTISDIYRDYLVIYDENEFNYCNLADIIGFYPDGSRIKVEVKEVKDKQWTAFGEQTFTFSKTTNWHNADCVIVINSSHDTIAELANDKCHVKKIVKL